MINRVTLITKDMQNATKILVLGILFFVSTVKADVAPSFSQTTFYFQKEGQPFLQPLKFTIKCYGTSAIGDTEKLLKISEMSEICQTYGCKYDTSNVFEVYRENIRYCDLEGKINGKKFIVNDFLGPSMSKLNCREAEYDIHIDDKFYKETSRYKNCMESIRKEYYPDDKNFICHRYLVEVPKEECGGYGWIIINEKCYKFTEKADACIAAMEQKKKLCNQYLEDVTSKLERRKDGFVFDLLCETKINIPSNIDKDNHRQTEVRSPSLQKNFFIRIIDLIKCFFFKLFGKSC